MRINTRLAYGRPQEVPRLVSVAGVALGHRLIVELLAGQTVDDYGKAKDQLTHMWRVTDVRVSVDTPGFVALTVVTHDPLAREVIPPRKLIPRDIHAVPVGVTETGEPWTISVDGVSTVIGGVPGAGKSVLLRGLMTTLLNLPQVSLYGVDLKGGVEFGSLRSRLMDLATSQEQAHVLLCRLI